MTIIAALVALFVLGLLIIIFVRNLEQYLMVRKVQEQRLSRLNSLSEKGKRVARWNNYFKFEKVE